MNKSGLNLVLFVSIVAIVAAIAIQNLLHENRVIREKLEQCELEK